jgi:hypothetical protein
MRGLRGRRLLVVLGLFLVTAGLILTPIYLKVNVKGRQWVAVDFATGSRTGGLQEAYNACSSTGAKTCAILLQPYTCTGSGATFTTGQASFIIDQLGLITATNTSGYCLKVDLTASPRGVFTWRNLKMDGTGSTGSGVQLISGQSVLIDGAVINKFQSANTFPLYMNFIEDSHLISVTMEENRNGVWLDGATNNNELDLKIGDNVGADGCAITINGGSGGNRFTGLVQSNHGRYTLCLGGITTAGGSDGITVAKNVFDNVHFENNGDGTSATSLVKFNTQQTPTATYVENTEFRSVIFTGGASGGGLGGGAGTMFTTTYSTGVANILIENSLLQAAAGLTDSTFTGFQPTTSICNGNFLVDTYNTIQNTIPCGGPPSFQAINTVNPAVPSTIAGGLAVGGNIQGNSLYNDAAGVLGETANLIEYSEFDSASLGTTWTQGCATYPQVLTANTTDVTDPLGGNTALKVVQPSTLCTSPPAASGQFQTISPALTAGKTYTFSFWARGVAGGENIFGYTTAPIYPTCTLTTSWKLCTATYVPTSLNNGGIAIAPNSSSAPSTYYIWRAQLEPGAGRGFYNHTTSAPVPSTVGSAVNDQIVKSLGTGTLPVCPNGAGGKLTTTDCIGLKTAIAASYAGVPPNGQILAFVPIAAAFTIPLSCTGSYGGAMVAATGTAAFSLVKHAGGPLGSATTLCTFTFSASGTVAAVAGSGGSFADGDYAEIDGPGTADATLATIGIGVGAIRTE